MSPTAVLPLSAEFNKLLSHESSPASQQELLSLVQTCSCLYFHTESVNFKVLQDHLRSLSPPFTHPTFQHSLTESCLVWVTCTLLPLCFCQELLFCLECPCPLTFLLQILPIFMAQLKGHLSQETLPDLSHTHLLSLLGSQDRWLQLTFHL